SEATFAPILKKEDGYIDWRMPAEKVHNRVRAFNPWPGTVAKFRGTVCKIRRSAVRAVDNRPQSVDPDSAGGHRPLLQPGLLVASKTSLAVVCGDGTPLEILLIQPEGRKAV